MILQDLGNIGDLIAGIATVGAVLIAWYQLRNLNKNLIASNLMTIFEIEFELNRRKERLSEIRQKNEEFLLKFKEQKPNENERELIKALEGNRKEAYENYLNVFDRLCYFVINKKLDENDFRLEYRDMLFDTIQSDNNTFGTGTKYRNMVKLFNNWKDK